MDHRITTKRRRHKWIVGEEYSLKLMSRHRSLFQPSNLDMAFEAFLRDSGQELIGHIPKNTYIIDLEGRSISSLFPDDTNKLLTFVITDGEVMMHRTPYKAFLDTCEANTELDITLPKEYDRDKALDIFKNAVVHFKMFWGEINYTPTTEKLTFRQFYGHYYVAPWPALVNYYGPEYIRLFGGRKKLKAVGFDSVTNFHKGVLASLESCQTPEQFKARQKEVQENLGQERFFEEKDDPHIHEALWKTKVETIDLDEVFAAINQLKASGELNIEPGDQLEITINKKQKNKSKQTAKK